MSEKSITLTVAGQNEDTESPVDVSFTVDYIEKTNVYLKVGDGDPVAISNADMLKVKKFLGKNMVGGTL